MKQYSLTYAQELDEGDPLKGYREQFYFPKMGQPDSAIYFCGNSLGLEPINVRSLMENELAHWADYGVEGHMKGETGWLYYHHLFTESLGRLVGAKNTEVVAMNTLTVNLHLLMLSFYRPTQNRYKIIMEAGAFPSDQYAMETQARMHGLNPKDVVIEVAPRAGEYVLRTEDIISTINLHKDELAVVMFGGVNYYTGQLYNMEAITKAGHEAGAMVGFDLAHAAGNVPLALHEWGVDFACWCSYKYLNAGPGAVSGVYIHEKHATDPSTFRLAGWWGYEEETRFLMKKDFQPMLTAESWQMSNAPVFNMIGLRASLKMFDEVGMQALREKSIKLTGYLIELLTSIDHLDFTMITPQEVESRGAQVSLLFHRDGKAVFDALSNRHIVVDWREPGVIRLAPVPMYNSYEDVYRFYEALRDMRI